MLVSSGIVGEISKIMFFVPVKIEPISCKSSSYSFVVPDLIMYSYINCEYIWNFDEVTNFIKEIGFGILMWNPA